MAPAKRYKVLVGSDVVYSGPWRTAQIVYESVVKAFGLVPYPGSPDLVPVVTLAFDI